MPGAPVCCKRWPAGALFRHSARRPTLTWKRRLSENREDGDRVKAKAIAATLATALAIVTLTGCGATKAVRTTVDSFDQLECSARKFKGEQPCSEEAG